MDNETHSVLVITADLPAFEELRESLHSDEHDAHDVAHAGSVVEGFARLKDDPADVLILDASTSAAGCLRSLERIRDRYPFLPLIILTKPDEEPFGRDLVERQLAHDYLVKSQCRDGIASRAIRHATERQRMREELQRYRDSVDEVTRIRNNSVLAANHRLQEEIDDHRRTEQELRDANRRLSDALSDLRRTERKIIQNERLNALGQMASGMMRDFKSALLPILEYSDLLLDKTEPKDDCRETHKMLEVIRDSSQEAARKINRLREFYERVDDDYAKLDINSIVGTSIEATQSVYKEEIEARGVHMQVNMELDESNPTIVGSEGQLSDTFAGIVHNAVDAMQRGGVLSVRTAAINQSVEIEFADTGMGMSETALHRCFEPFYTTKGVQRTGIGLSLAYGVVKAHGGTIDVRSHSGKGTSVLIRLPDSNASSFRNASRAMDDIEPLDVLLIDDDEKICNVMRNYLESDGHTVTIAMTGSDGLGVFGKERFDIVITDSALPDVSGERVVDMIREQSSRVPIIMITGFGDFMLETGIKPPGVNAVVGKPLTLNELRRVVANVVEKVIDADNPN